MLAAATLVAGGRRHLDAVDVPASARIVEFGDVTVGVVAVVDHVRAARGPAVVLASGDPGYFGIVAALRRHGLEPRVHPAVSSVAMAFARLGLPWDDAVVVSAHGRDLGPAVNVCRAHPKVAVLTGPTTGPAQIGLA
ncbi:MAG: precorrin-6y C5,15-methyltransferase (decarboxylating) subunit CbiE, partial [Frankia sp.]